LDMLILSSHLLKQTCALPDARQSILSLGAAFGAIALVVAALEIASNRGGVPSAGEASSGRPVVASSAQPVAAEASHRPAFRPAPELP